jgi:hypothetical protein
MSVWLSLVSVIFTQLSHHTPNITWIPVSSGKKESDSLDKTWTNNVEVTRILLLLLYSVLKGMRMREREARYEWKGVQKSEGGSIKGENQIIIEWETVRQLNTTLSSQKNQDKKTESASLPLEGLSHSTREKETTDTSLVSNSFFLEICITSTFLILLPPITAPHQWMNEWLEDTGYGVRSDTRETEWLTWYHVLYITSSVRDDDGLTSSHTSSISQHQVLSRESRDNFSLTSRGVQLFPYHSFDSCSQICC